MIFLKFLALGNLIHTAGYLILRDATVQLYDAKVIAKYALIILQRKSIIMRKNTKVFKFIKMQASRHPNFHNILPHQQ